MVKNFVKLPVFNNFSYLLFTVKVFLSYAIVMQLDVEERRIFCRQV